MEKCECFRLATNYHGDYCAGTKECDSCSCGGDPRKCDFYEDIRNEANKMTTLDMMNEAKKTGRTYVCGDVNSDNMRYNLTYGFHFMYDHKPWNADAFKYLNDVFASDMKWQIIPDNCFTIEEAEAKFNIKIVV